MSAAELSMCFARIIVLKATVEALRVGNVCLLSQRPRR